MRPGRRQEDCKVGLCEPGLRQLRSGGSGSVTRGASFTEVSHGGGSLAVVGGNFQADS